MTDPAEPTIPDYRNLLLEEFARRSQANSRYSLRAYARDLRLSPSRLSEIFAGKNGLSTQNAASVAKLIHLNDEEVSWFCDLVAAKHARSEAARSQAARRVRLRLDGPVETLLKRDAFRYIADWYFLALVELIGTADFRSDPEWIAKRLGISTLVARDAVLTLKRLGIVAEKENILRVVGEFRTTTESVPSKAIRKFHSQMILKAEKALQNQPVEERDISCIVMPISTDDLPVARKMIQDFRRELNRVLGASEKPKTEVYSFSVQLFKLTEKSEMDF